MRIVLLATLLVAFSWLAINCCVVCLAEGIFAHAQPYSGALFDRTTAGTLFGDLLLRWVQFADACLWPLLGLLLVILGGFAMRARLGLTAVCLLALISLIVIHDWARITVEMTAGLRPPLAGAVAVPDKPYTDDMRQRFLVLHERSKTLFTSECVLLLLISLGAAVALLRRQQDVLGTSASQPSR